MGHYGRQQNAYGSGSGKTRGETPTQKAGRLRAWGRVTPVKTVKTEPTKVESLSPGDTVRIGNQSATVKSVADKGGSEATKTVTTSAGSVDVPAGGTVERETVSVTYLVQGDTGDYTVIPGIWTCTCKSQQYRGKCESHAVAARMYHDDAQKVLAKWQARVTVFTDKWLRQVRTTCQS